MLRRLVRRARALRASALIALCLLLAGSGDAPAQEHSFACNKICWNPVSASAICSLKLTQYDLTAYIWAVQHDLIKKGKGLTFSLSITAPRQDCSSVTEPGQWVAVSGYVQVRSVTAFSIGSLKVGDLIEVRGNGVAADQRNVMFYADPAYH
jgi:hypothetical protein